MKIAVYTIAKNEEAKVRSWVDSNKDADVRLVCDTGSADGTASLLRDAGVEVASIQVAPWRFDVARGCSLNLLPADVDVCIWQDLDEVLLPGWRAEIEQHWTDGVTTAFHKYRNNTNPWQWHSKIHARHGCMWVGSVHETLQWMRPERDIWLSNVWLQETQDTSKDRSHYLPNLLKKIAEGDSNWKTYYFLANEYQAIDPAQSIKYREESYKLCHDGPVAQSYVARVIAVQYGHMGNDTLAEQWFLTSTTVSNERETWFHMARYYHQRQRWLECLLAVTRCIHISIRRDGYTNDPEAWSSRVYTLGIDAAAALDMPGEVAKLKLAQEQQGNTK